MGMERNGRSCKSDLVPKAGSTMADTTVDGIYKVLLGQ